MSRRTEFALFALAASLWTLHWLWPLPLQLDHHLIAAPYWWDAQLAIDLLDQGRHNLLHQPWHLLDSRILHPAPQVQAWSENFLAWAPLQAVLVPLVGPTATFNLSMLAVLFGSVLATFAWLRPRTRSVWAAAAGAVFFSYAPWRLGLLGRLQLESTVLLPLILLALEHALTTPHWRRWALVAGLFAAQMGLCIYYGVYLLALAAPVVAWQVLRDKRHRSVYGMRQLATGGALVGLPVVWLLHPYATVTRDMGFARDDHAIYASSGTLRDLLTSSDLMAHWQQFAMPAQAINTSGREPVAFAGVVGPLLAVFGLVLVVAQWRHSRGQGPTRPLEHAPFRFGPATLLLWIALCGIGFFGTGPNAPLHGQVYGTLLKAVPLLSGLRYSNRWMVPLTLFGAGFVAWGVDALVAAARKPLVGHGMAAVAVLALAVELDTVALPLVPAPQPEAIYTQLAQDHAAGALLELPMDGIWHTHRIDRNDGVRVHGLPIVGGFTGYNPPLHDYLREVLVDPGSELAHQTLAQLGVNRVVAHLHQSADPRALLAQLDAAPWLQRVSSDGRDAVYAVPEVPADRARQVRQTWSHSPLLRRVPDDVVPMPALQFHANPATNGLLVHFAAPACVTGLIFDHRAAPLAFPRRFAVTATLPDGSGKTLRAMADYAPLQVLAMAPARALAELPLPPTLTTGLWLHGVASPDGLHVRVGTTCPR